MRENGGTCQPISTGFSIRWILLSPLSYSESLFFSFLFFDTGWQHRMMQRQRLTTRLVATAAWGMQY
jgi:hypothetical protein